MEICPCCKRKIPATRTKMDKRIVQDVEKAQAAIAMLRLTVDNPRHTQMYGEIVTLDGDNALRQAASDEIARLNRAIVDHRLLWTIYRRKDNKPPYYQTESLSRGTDEWFEARNAADDARDAEELAAD
jgi:hypothetical protein